MAQENWLAVESVDLDVHALLARYGFHIDTEETIGNPGNLSAVHWEARPPRGSSPFYVFRTPRWTLIDDGDSLLWEHLSVHAQVSRALRCLVVVLVSRTASDAFGYGVFNQGAVERWLFKGGNAVGQEYGKPYSWENDSSTAATVGEHLRRIFGIDLSASPQVQAYFAQPPGRGVPPAGWRRFLPWLPGSEAAERHP